MVQVCRLSFAVIVRASAGRRFAFGLGLFAADIGIKDGRLNLLVDLQGLLKLTHLLLEELVLLLEVRNLLCLVILGAERRWRTQELLATGGHAIGTGVVGVVGLRLIVDGERLLARPIDPLREVDVHIL